MLIAGTNPMNKPFCRGPNIVIGNDFIRLKETDTKLTYGELRSVSIRNVRVHRAGLLFILAGVVALVLILWLFLYAIIGLGNDTANPASHAIFYRKHGISLVLFLFIGGPVFIVSKTRKYFKKYPMLVIRWGSRDFRIKIADLDKNADELRMFFDGKKTH